MVTFILPTELPSPAEIEAFFSYLALSPTWAPFWYSLYEGVGSCVLLWIQVYCFGRCTEITLELAAFITMHLATILIVSWFACYRDGWTDTAVTQCLGMVPVLCLDLITVYILYWRPRSRLGLRG